MIIHGDCIEQMKLLEENSIDAIITDPPYGIGFMGKEWDNFKPSKIDEAMKKDKRPHTKIASQRRSNTAGTYDLSPRGLIGFQKWMQKVSVECFRILKPGGYFLVFGGTRTYHRLVCGIEDAGFEIRDTIMWLYGSGFPKSLNIGKQIDKIRGNKREVVGVSKNEKDFRDVGKKVKEEIGINKLSFGTIENAERKELEITKGNSEWEGWGTALKPAVEPIVVARKPLSEKNVALNVLKHGTGGINIDACRVEYIGKTDPRTFGGSWKTDKCAKNVYEGGYEGTNQQVSQQGRFPANIILDEEAGKMLDEQSGKVTQGHWSKTKTKGFGDFGGGSSKYFGVGLKDKTKHGASRFFYCAKASKSERNFGCEEMKDGKPVRWNKGGIWTNDTTPAKNNHPTVKPIKLMEYLVKLVSREGAIVLDPFLGSGTTAIACLKQDRKFIGIEKEEKYVKIAEARIKPFLGQKKLINSSD